MKIISKILDPLYEKIVIFYYLFKYKSIWGIKLFLQSVDTRSYSKLIQAYNSYFSKYGAYIDYSSKFKSMPILPHSWYGIFISGGAVIGKNVVIFQQVTIGSNTLKGTKKNGSPTIGNNVYIGAGAKIIGGVTIGDNCRIGANAVVYNDMPSNSVAVQQPTRILNKKEKMDNKFYSSLNGEFFYKDNGNWVKVE